MQLLTSHSFTASDATAIEDFEKDSAFAEAMIASFEDSFQELATEIERDHVRGMLWMLHHGALEIKVVVPKTRLNQPDSVDSSIYHPKFGVLVDSQGSMLAFAGSLNETANGWTRNIENLNVYSSESTEQKQYLDDYLDEFEKYWSDDVGPDWAVLDLPKAVSLRIIQSTGIQEPMPDLRPISIASDNPGGLRDYQQEALEAWVAAGRVGILEMATGTGKTRTARECIRNASREAETLLTVVVAPYQHIADQWAKELAEFSPFEIAAMKSWRDEMSQLETNMLFGRASHTVIVVVKNTAGSADFQNALEPMMHRAERTLIVADEVHWLGANAFRASLSHQADWRLGLSATPQRYFDEDGSQFLQDYFMPAGREDATVFSFSIRQALDYDDPVTKRKILCPYNYWPIAVTLTEEETEEYDNWSASIAKLMGKDIGPEEQRKLDNYRISRALVVKKAQNKIQAFSELIAERGTTSLDFALVYCAESSQMQAVGELLSTNGVDFGRITSAESAKPSKRLQGLSERETILNAFTRGRLRSLLAIDCLDEGVDIPAARTGYILASSGNPKEFIQRRGRLMRQHRGKDEADIFDFVVLPTGGSHSSMRENELNRMKEFAEDANNREQLMTIIKEFELGGEGA